jgi:diaminopimelate decarboxylase
MNDLLRPALYSSYHFISPLSLSAPKGRKAPTQKYDIVGPVCETSDCFATGRALPGENREGDLLAIFSAGAYGFTMSGNYNSRTRPAEVLIEEKKPKLIRKREMFDDLIRGENGL